MKRFKRVIDPTLAKVGSRIREARIKRGLTIAALAKILKTSGSALGQIENGWRSITPTNLDKIAKALGTTRLHLGGLDEKDFWTVVRACDAWDRRAKRP